MTDAPTRVRLQLIREAGTCYRGMVDAGRPALLARFLASQVDCEPYETLGAVFLDTRHRVVDWGIFYRGTLDRCACEPRAFLTAALLANAAGLALFHNHPSGDPSPSAEDLAFTRRMDDAASVLGLRLVDHVILGSEGRYTSLRERGGW